MHVSVLDDRGEASYAADGLADSGQVRRSYRWTASIL